MINFDFTINEMDSRQALTLAGLLQGVCGIRTPRITQAGGGIRFRFQAQPGQAPSAVKQVREYAAGNDLPEPTLYLASDRDQADLLSAMAGNAAEEEE